MWRKREIEEAKMQDEEFSRLETESRVRQEYVRQSIRKAQELANKIDRELGIPFVTAEELEELLKKD
jgi:hypothetical protein